MRSWHCTKRLFPQGAEDLMRLLKLYASHTYMKTHPPFMLELFQLQFLLLFLSLFISVLHRWSGSSMLSNILELAIILCVYYKAVVYTSLQFFFVADRRSRNFNAPISYVTANRSTAYIAPTCTRQPVEKQGGKYLRTRTVQSW